MQLLIRLENCFAALCRGLFFSAILCIAIFVLSQTASAAAPGVVKGGSTRIVSEKMTYDSTSNLVIFEGKVHVTRPNMQIWSEKLTMVLENDGKKTMSSGNTGLGMQGGKVERIIAERNVRIKQENKNGTCGRATYYINAGKILMEQNPVIVDGDNRIRGQVINYYTETGRSEVMGDVDVQFTTEDSKGPEIPTLSSPAGEQQGTTAKTTSPATRETDSKGRAAR